MAPSFGPRRGTTVKCWKSCKGKAWFGSASMAPCMISVMRCVKAANPLGLARYEMHNIEAVLDRVVIKSGQRDRLADSVEACLRLGDGSLIASVENDGQWTDHPFSESFACELHPECSAARTRTSDVLLQQSFRGVPGLRRARPHARVRRGFGGPRSVGRIRRGHRAVAKKWSLA